MRPIIILLIVIVVPIAFFGVLRTLAFEEYSPFSENEASAVTDLRQLVTAEIVWCHQGIYGILAPFPAKAVVVPRIRLLTDNEKACTLLLVLVGWVEK